MVCYACLSCLLCVKHQIGYSSPTLCDLGTSALQRVENTNNPQVSTKPLHWKKDNIYLYRLESIVELIRQFPSRIWPWIWRLQMPVSWGCSSLLPSLATRLYSVFTLLYIYMPAPILNRNLWPSVGHLVHTISTRGRLVKVASLPPGHYTNMPCQCGYPDGMSPRGRMVFPKTILPRGNIPSGYPHWHGIFVLLYRTNPNVVKYQ